MASGTTATASTTANHVMVPRQPIRAMPRSNIDGQTAPAMYCPLEISANAVPRRRSNQRTDIDIERRVDAGIAQKADEQSMAQPRRHGTVAGRDDEAYTNHYGTKGHRPAHANAIGDAPHADAPTAVPSHASEYASAGTDRALPSSAAICFSETTATNGAP